jgi:hypothetical protein
VQPWCCANSCERDMAAGGARPAAGQLATVVGRPWRSGGATANAQRRWVPRDCRPAQGRGRRGDAGGAWARGDGARAAQGSGDARAAAGAVGSRPSRRAALWSGATNDRRRLKKRKKKKSGPTERFHFAVSFSVSVLRDTILTR